MEQHRPSETLGLGHHAREILVGDPREAVHPRNEVALEADHLGCQRRHGSFAPAVTEAVAHSVAGDAAVQREVDHRAF